MDQFQDPIWMYFFEKKASVGEIKMVISYLTKSNATFYLKIQSILRFAITFCQNRRYLCVKNSNQKTDKPMFPLYAYQRIEFYLLYKLWSSLRWIRFGNQKEM